MKKKNELDINLDTNIKNIISDQSVIVDNSVGLQVDKEFNEEFNIEKRTNATSSENQKKDIEIETYLKKDIDIDITLEGKSSNNNFINEQLKNGLKEKNIDIRIKKENVVKLSISPKSEIEKADLSEVMKEIEVNEISIIKKVIDIIIDFVDNKCLIIKLINEIDCKSNVSSDIKSKYQNDINFRTREINKSSSLKRKEEVIKILDEKYKNKLDEVSRDHIIKLYVNNSTRFMVTL